MAGSSGVLKKVLRLKLQLKEAAGPDTVLKALQQLSDLDITLDILTETGIGKTVNSLRRHEEAGDVAKSLVKDWKKLLSNTTTSHTEEVSDGLSQPRRLGDCESLDKGGFLEDDFNNNCVTSKGVESEEEYKHRKENNKRKRKENQRDEKHLYEMVQREKKKAKDKDGDLDSRPHDGAGANSTRTKSETQSHQSNKKSQPKESLQYKPSDGKPLKTLLKVDSAENREVTPELRSSERKYKKGKDVELQIKPKNEESEEDPSLSFESCLNYDEHLSKRCRRAVKKTPKKTEVKQKSTKTSEAVKPVKSPEKTATPASPQKGFMDNLINIPLPTVLLDCENPSSFEYYERKVEKKSYEVLDESTVFTGQRLNKKMQVYSGAKTVFLPAMMSLYQQCIRTLQNNIDLLYETGGVPFEVLEPVLERCTPEQLLRIEEFNPMYIGETDHLWGKHCQRDFKDSKLLEYESWKEMYVRLSEEREKKFQRLKKSIASAHSSRPQGRQVKMAFIHTVAKPPRDVRIQQEIHGTAVQQPTCSVKTHENKSVPKTEPPRSTNASAATSNNQDPRKKTKVAPMMAKSLKAFKKQMGRR
ncbi:elongin A, like [Synchiropus picturatus]